MLPRRGWLRGLDSPRATEVQGDLVAVLRNRRTGQRCIVQPDCVIGRSRDCALQLEQTQISSRHAQLRWTGTEWEARDLGSRNGTFVNDRRLDPGVPERLRKGAVISFGVAEQVWVLDDDGIPQPMIVSLTDGVVSPLTQDLVGIPSPDNPQATIYRSAEGAWILEPTDRPSLVLENGATFRVGEQDWRFVCYDLAPPTTVSSQAPAVPAARLSFAVSRDEEHVELTLICNGKRFELGSRARNYLLLTLARHRLADAATGLPETSCGWIYQEELADQLGTSVGQINVDVFRIREQLRTLNLPALPEVIQRRARIKQLRIGFVDNEIRTL